MSLFDSDVRFDLADWERDYRRIRTRVVMLPAPSERSGFFRPVLAALMIVALLLAPFHAHAFISADGTVVAVALGGDSNNSDDSAPAKGEGGCAACWLAKKLQMPLREASPAALPRGLAVLMRPPREGDMAPRSAIFDVFRPPSTGIV